MRREYFKNTGGCEMRNVSKMVLLGLLTVSLNACAFTTSVIKIDYAPTKYSSSQKLMDLKETVSVDKFTDQRGGEPNLLSYKGVTHRTSGKYLSDKEVSAIVTEATKALLITLGYPIVNDIGDFRLTGELLKFDSTPIMGFWSGQLEGVAQLNLKLKDNKTGSIVWQEMFSGSAKKTGLQVDSEVHRKEVIENTLDDLMSKIAASQSLREFLEQRAQMKPDKAVSP
jgi:hypothetical protein